jgi:hypothetical protein
MREASALGGHENRWCTATVVPTNLCSADRVFHRTVSDSDDGEPFGGEGENGTTLFRSCPKSQPTAPRLGSRGVSRGAAARDPVGPHRAKWCPKIPARIRLLTEKEYAALVPGLDLEFAFSSSFLIGDQ